jgi:hypothetical protein
MQQNVARTFALLLLLFGYPVSLCIIRAFINVDCEKFFIPGVHRKVWREDCALLDRLTLQPEDRSRYLHKHVQ